MELIEQRLVSTLELTAVHVPLGAIDVVYRDQPLSVRTRVYRGGAVDYGRFVTIRSPSLEVDNALLVPAAGTDIPFYGVDLVRIAGGPVITALDLSPTAADDNTRIAIALSWKAEAGGAADWAKPYLSQAAYVVKGSAPPPDLIERLQTMTTAYLSLVTTRKERPELPQRREYMRAHRDDQAGMTWLARILGEELGSRFINEVLFPSLERREQA